MSEVTDKEKNESNESNKNKFAMWGQEAKVKLDMASGCSCSKRAGHGEK